MVRMGMDEDGFLLGLAEVYGPVAYLPWPLKQYVVLESDAIERMYQTPVSTLGFVSSLFQPRGCGAYGRAAGDDTKGDARNGDRKSVV